eukprot:4977255-Pleurochrysis_carterae.AAC.1
MQETDGRRLRTKAGIQRREQSATRIGMGSGQERHSKVKSDSSKAAKAKCSKELTLGHDTLQVLNIMDADESPEADLAKHSNVNADPGRVARQVKEEEGSNVSEAALQARRRSSHIRGLLVCKNGAAALPLK